ncbi:site-specific integrase [Kitasatospora sp. NBC_00039]|uniref:site-specific integrase n=1 Tax=Kitasatospora sp. NBC_00039 TaxID=2903565 RepID=UPI00386B14DC
MILTFFSSHGWQSWDIEHRPLIPEGMPVLVDDDLRFDDGPAAPRPAAVVNRWLRELPTSGAPAPSSWENYARVLKAWTEFLAEHGVGLFDSRERLKAGLSRYAEHRAAGPAEARFAATTWGQHMSILSLFYRWAMAEDYAPAEPFTYRSARALFAGTGREVRVNLAVRRTPKPHVTIKYLEPDFTELFRKGLRGLAPDGSQDTGFHSRELARNAAIADLALATGLRLQEFTYLLPWEIPVLPKEPTTVPIPFPVPAGIAKGKKFRTTWTSYEALAGLHDYLALDRAATAEGSAWRPPRRWGEPLMVTEPDHQGGRVNGMRRSWDSRRTPPPGRPRRRIVPAGSEERRRPVHRLVHGLRTDLGPDPGPLRAPLPACLAPPMSPHVLDEDLGIPGHRPLPAGREARARHRRGCRAGSLPLQGRPVACAARFVGSLHCPDDGKVPPAPGHDPHLPGRLRRRRGRSRADLRRRG